MFIRSGRARAGVRATLLCLACALPAGACADDTARDATADAASAEGDAAGVRDAAAAALVVIDDAGDTVRLARPARRIVSLVPAQTEILLALGARDRLVARTAFDTQPELADLPSTGNALTPNVEWIAAQRPDLVVSWADAQSRSVVTRLATLDIPAYASSVETIDDITSSVLRLGTLTGRDAAADSIVRAMEDGLAAVAGDVAGRVRPRVLYVIGLDPLMVAGPGSFVHEAIVTAGGDNVFADARSGWPVVSMEEVLRRDPEVIVFGVSRTAAEADSLLARLRTQPGWRDLAALRTGRAHWADPYTFNRPSPAIADNARRLAGFFHEARP